MLLLLQLAFQGEQRSEFPYPRWRIIIKETLSLAYEICDVRSILRIVLVPSPVEKLPVLLDGSAGYENDRLFFAYEVFAKRLMVVCRWFHTEDYLLQEILTLYHTGMKEQFFKAFFLILKGELSQESFSGRGPEKGTVPVLRYIDPHYQMILRAPNAGP